MPHTFKVLQPIDMWANKRNKNQIHILIITLEKTLH